ncbi:MAG: hypothetical protein A2Y16_05450 [Tenericutes bacterium GWF2_57_13]|nr:MAG: hypothetical protein A2Y16_05450 [Tenericutes bacterium GWF2_57_13]
MKRYKVTSDYLKKLADTNHRIHRTEFRDYGDGYYREAVEETSFVKVDYQGEITIVEFYNSDHILDVDPKPYIDDLLGDGKVVAVDGPGDERLSD